MPQNFQPIFPLTGQVSNNAGTGMNQLVTAAANDYTGAGANNTLCFTGGANGSFLERIRFKAGGTNTASVARIFLNNGSTNATATNNSFYGEITLPATTAIATAATVEIDYPMGIVIPAGFRVYWGLATAVAAGWSGVGIGGDY